MYIVLYSFVVKPDQEEAFVASWTKLTNLIYKYEGSLGSRLHKSEGHEYIAYAQWPNKNIFNNAGSNLPKEANHFRDIMKASCKKIEVLRKLEVVEDLLKEIPNV